jgi:homocitrate synthase NifV
LEEVVMALKYIYGVDLGINTDNFSQLSQLVANAVGSNVPPWKAIVGKNTMSKNIHDRWLGFDSHSIVKNPEIYRRFALPGEW